MLDTKTIRDEIYSVLGGEYDRIMSGQKESSDDEMTFVLDDTDAEMDREGKIREVTLRVRIAIVNVKVDDA
jgi:hypothetical protein